VTVFIVVRHSSGYYDGEYSVDIDGIFSTSEKAQAAAMRFTDIRHSVEIEEVVVDEGKTIYIR
jgi:ABC-type Zn2+ transport system substrate-binding protein/surface adhesin